jgi:hypothetical protein
VFKWVKEDVFQIKETGGYLYTWVGGSAQGSNAKYSSLIITLTPDLGILLASLLGIQEVYLRSGHLIGHVTSGLTVIPSQCLSVVYAGGVFVWAKH